MHQFGQFADLRLKDVDLLLLAKDGAIQRLEMVLRQAEFYFELADSGFHADYPDRREGRQSAPFGQAGNSPAVGQGSGEILRREIPVGQGVQEGLDELGAGVAVVDVVGVFPDVDGEQGLVFRV
jgi:hypothetical protein